MQKRIISLTIVLAIMFSMTVPGTSAQTLAPANPVGVSQSDATGLRAALAAESAKQLDGKETLQSYEAQKKRGKKFSTTTKILIGVGVAAAVVGVAILVASRSKFRLL